MLFKYENDWVLEKSPAGAHQWTPANPDPEDMAPDPEDASIKVPTMMTTADMAMIRDHEYRKISKMFHENLINLPTLSPVLGSNYCTEIWGQKSDI